MTKPTDHVSDAQQYAISAWNSAGEDRVDRRWIEQANISAQLALVAEQARSNDIADRANELKRIEILAQLDMVHEDDPDHIAQLTSEALQAKADGKVDRAFSTALTPVRKRLAPSIARSLGLGGESDGE